ncbi:MAG TPA: hypothetical protein VHD36_08530 [Pirellulales bacterium]|nr:hypothetical protein [Pirellulales bacterium]
MSVPIRPVRPGDLISAAKFNEVVDAVNALGQISGSYPIEVAHDDMGVRIGLARQFKAWLFRIEAVPTTVPRTDDNVPYYNATRLRLDTTNDYTAQSPQHVVLYDPLAKDVAAKLLKEGAWVLATFDADTGRWQIVRDPFPGTQLVRFKLTATLTLGGSATATIRKWDPTAGGGAGAYVDGDTITVKDYFGALGDPGEWQAPSGYYGYAVKLTDLDEYQILYMEHQAEFAAFTLTANMSAGSAAATFDSFWMGRNTASETLVYDRQNLAASARSGDKGIACWDSKLGRYEIIWMGRGAPSDPVLFYLNDALTRGGSAAATIRQWNGGAGTWDATGASITVYDSSNLVASGVTLPISTLGVCFLSSQSGRYEIIAVPGAAGAQIVRFKTTAPLTLGGSCTANVQTWDAGTSAYVDGDTITVVDFYGSLGRRGAWQAPSGYYGFALKLPDKDEWQILTMEKVALFATATLSENMGATTAGQAAASFSGSNKFWQGQDTAGAAVVYDPVGIWSALPSGSSVVVCYDDNEQKYKIIDAPGQGSLVRVKLTAPLAVGGTAAAVIRTWDGAAYNDGAAVTVHDYAQRFSGPTGALGYAAPLDGRYELVFLCGPALLVQATLTEAMGATTAHQAAATTVDYAQGSDPGASVTVTDPLHIYDSLTSGKSVLACWNDRDAAYEIVDAPQSGGAVSWARTYAAHTLDTTSKSNAHYVECQAVDNFDGDGYDSGSPHFHVFLPSPSTATDPNVEAGVIIGYTVDEDGNAVCVTGYLDDARGMLKTWSGAAADIPHGWQLCDGSNGTPDLRGRFILGAQPGGSIPFDDDGDSNNVGETGGTLKHTHAAHAPQATTATSLSATSTSLGVTDSEFVGTPAVLSFDVNMTGQPTAVGVTGPTALQAFVVLPDVTIEPTSLSGDHQHDLDNDSLNVVTGKGGIVTDIITHSPTGDPSPSDFITPNPHTHAATVTPPDDEPDDTIQPNPHNHSVNVPVVGITFSPSTTSYTPAGTVISDPAIETTTTIAPNPHTHQTPTLTHDMQYHTPQYFALCYIMRVN